MFRLLLCVLVIGLSVSSAEAGTRRLPSQTTSVVRQGGRLVVVVNNNYGYSNRYRDYDRRCREVEPPDAYELMKLEYFRRTYGPQPTYPTPTPTQTVAPPQPMSINNPYYAPSRFTPPLRE